MDKPTSGAVDTDLTTASATDTTQGTEAKGDEKSATEQGGFYSFSDMSNEESIDGHFSFRLQKDQLTEVLFGININ